MGVVFADRIATIFYSDCHVWNTRMPGVGGYILECAFLVAVPIRGPEAAGRITLCCTYPSKGLRTHVGIGRPGRSGRYLMRDSRCGDQTYIDDGRSMCCVRGIFPSGHHKRSPIPPKTDTEYAPLFNYGSRILG